MDFQNMRYMGYVACRNGSVCSVCYTVDGAVNVHCECACLLVLVGADAG